MPEHYDVAVLGGQPAGYLAAALLAKRGLRTVVVDHGEGFDSYTQGGVTYPLVPQPLIGLKGSPLVETVLAELGAQVDFPRRYAESDPSFQVIYPRHRLNLGADRTALVREVRREFQAAGDDFERLMQVLDERAELVQRVLLREPVLPAPGWFSRWLQARHLRAATELDGAVSRLPVFASLSEHPLRELIVESARFFSHFDDPDPPVAGLAFLISSLATGTIRVEGLGGTYVEALQGLVTQAGGEVKRGALIENIVTSGGRLTGLELATGRQSLSADWFLGAAYSGELYKTLRASRPQQKLANQNAELRTRGKLFIQHFLVQERGVAVGFGDNVLLLNGRRRSREGGDADTSVWITLRPSYTPKHALLSAAIPVKDSEASSLPEQLTYQRNRVKKQLERLMPFLPPFIAAESSPMAPGEWDAVELPMARRLDTWALHPVYEPMPNRLFGITGLPFTTPFKNLMRVGREVFPGLGSVGDFASARMAAELVVRGARK